MHVDFLAGAGPAPAELRRQLAVQLSSPRSALRHSPTLKSAAAAGALASAAAADAASCSQSTVHVSLR